MPLSRSYRSADTWRQWSGRRRSTPRCGVGCSQSADDSEGMPVSGLQRFALIGFGEGGSILGEDLAAAGHSVAMYDILLDSANTRGPMLERARGARVRAA